MGCSGIRDKYVLKNNQFYKEAMSFEGKKNLKGLHLDKNEDNTKTMKIPEGANRIDCNFMEEIIDHATESGSVKPWIKNIVCPEQDMEEILSLPKYKLKIEHIFGFRVENSRQNLFFLSKDQLLYFTSCLGIIQNIDDYSQILFGGFQSKEGRECHDNDIMSIAFYNGDVSMVATGQRGMSPKILVWSPLDTSVVYAKFQQPKGSKEVAGLAFDKDGHYLISFGRDPLNSFYIFDMQSKKPIWDQPTDEKNNRGRIEIELKEEEDEYGTKIEKSSSKFLLDAEFSTTKRDEVCLVGVNKIIFGIVSQKYFKNAFHEDPMNPLVIYTTVKYLPNGKCLIGSDQGEILIYKNAELQGVFSVSKKLESIQNIAYSPYFKKIYVSDSLGYVYIVEERDGGIFKRIDKFKMSSVVKSLDVNEDEDIVCGLSNGDIIIKHYREKIKSEEIILQSHSEGSICGLDYIPENRVVTTGEDNKIIVWNLRSKKCEHIGMINEVLMNPNATSDKDLYSLQARNKSNTVSYNSIKGEIAVGINDGTISIRAGIKKLDVKVCEDIHLEEYNPENPDDYYGITELKYTNYGDLLAVAAKTGNVAILDCNNDYAKNYMIKPFPLGSYITNFDWDMTNKFLQVITSDNKYDFIDLEKKCLIKDAEITKRMDWPRITCKFGYTVQGVYLGSTDPDFISCVCKANSKKIILTGDDDCLLNLFNYPTVEETHKWKSFKGHSGRIRKIVFSPDDEKVVTIAEEDKAVIFWNLVPD